ncbi:MAG: ATP-binding cassette domain-containing protein [Pirellulales bacterium]|nr:ATP-binding cassette domain-containing protein [Pirellulales bacterium]
MSTPLLAANDLTRRAASGNTLLSRVSLTLHAGDRVSVTGPSGVGKTLLLRALAMLDPLDSGELLWRGSPVEDADVPQVRSQLMYLGQRSALLEGTVEDNFRAPFSCKVHADQNFDRGRILAWLKLLGRSEDFLSKRHTQLSGGEAQIMALLRALQFDPLVLLADEPMAAMDVATAMAAEAIILEWLQQPPPTSQGQDVTRALLWVSHDEAQSRRVATASLNVHGGRVECEVVHTVVDVNSALVTRNADEVNRGSKESP